MSLRYRQRDIQDTDSFDTDDLIELVEADRAKIRSLSQAILVVCGFLITAIVGIISALLKDVANKPPVYVIPLFGVVAVIISYSLSKSITAMRISPLENPAAKRDSLTSLNITRTSELGHSNTAIRFLYVSMFGFLIAMSSFFVNYYEIGVKQIVYSFYSQIVYNGLTSLIKIAYFTWVYGSHLLKPIVGYI